MRPPLNRRTKFVRRRRRRLSATERWLLTLLVLAALAATAQSFDPAWVEQLRRISVSDYTVILIASAALALVAAILLSRLPLRAWHAFANAAAEKEPVPLAAPWVVDGDTIDDRATGVRYRLANIDAPETGDNAKCFHERQRGEQARSMAIVLVRGATTVAVRRTFRHDRYRRRVAFVSVDGRDLGDLLIERGFAKPWRGKRERWCGPHGGLARIAARGGWSMSCRTCGITQERSPPPRAM